MNTMSGSVVGCDITLKNSHPCGVQAIGRCTTCERTFCLSHQARDVSGVGYTAWCLPCQQEQQAAEQKRWQAAATSHEYFLSGTARADLLKAGVPPVEMYEVSGHWKTKWTLLGRREEEVDEVNIFGRGWILGEFSWQCSFPVLVGKDNGKNSRVEYGGDSNTASKQWLTALMDMSLDDLSRLVHSTNNQHATENSTLVRVRPYSGSYQVLFALRDYFGDFNSFWWCEAEQAVERLIKESS